MSIAIASNIIDGKTVTISGHGDVTIDVFEAVRNNDTTPKDIEVRYRKTGNTQIIPNVQPGDTLPAEIDILKETNTTATSVSLFKLN